MSRSSCLTVVVGVEKGTEQGMGPLGLRGANSDHNNSNGPSHSPRYGRSRAEGGDQMKLWAMSLQLLLSYTAGILNADCTAV